MSDSHSPEAVRKHIKVYWIVFVALLVVVLLPIGGLRITDAISWVLAPVVVWLITALATLFLPMIFLKKKVVEARESRP